MCVHSQQLSFILQEKNQVTSDNSLWTVARQVPLAMGLSRQDYCSGLPFPSPGESSHPRDQIRIPCIAGRFFTTEPIAVIHINHSKCIPKVKEGNLHRSNHVRAKEIFYPCRQGKAKHENLLVCCLTTGLHSSFFRKIFIWLHWILFGAYGIMLAALGLIWGTWDHGSLTWDRTPGPFPLRAQSLSH